MLPKHVLDRIADGLADVGALPLDDFLDAQPAPPPRPAEPADPSPVTRLHQACQRALRSTDGLRFEYVEQPASKNKQCILTITKPDGVQRAYATQPLFAKKNEAKSEAARIAIDMGALDFLAGEDGEARPVVSPESSTESLRPKTAPETCVDDIERCCLDWRAGRVAPNWVPFTDARSAHKQGCALRIQLSPHVGRVYLSDPVFDSHSDARGACARAAVQEGVMAFVQHGNGQTRPSSPSPSSSSTPPVVPSTPWTLQAFYDSLPRPFPESFDTDDASAINAPGRLNTMVQNARGGKLMLSFFFTSDGPPGLHGCVLKLDRPGEYKAFLVDARFLKRSDAKAAVCLLALSEGIGNYIRSITSAVDTKITPAMRSFSSSLVYPALMSELSKIDTDLHPRFDYDKERDAFGATLIVRLSASPAPEQTRRYTVSRDYRNKADAKAAVVCHAAEQGVVEFVRFRGGIPPTGYQSLYMLHAYNPEASRKRRQPESIEDAEQEQPAKKRKKKKRGKRQVEMPSRDQGGPFTAMGQRLSAHSSGNQTHGISGPGDMGPSQSFPVDGSCDPSQPGVGGEGGSGAALRAMYGHGPSYGAQVRTSSYPAVPDPRFAGLAGLEYGVCPSGSGTELLHVVPMPSDNLLSRAWPGTSSRAARRPAEGAELEPGEVVSSPESDFSESSSRNEDAEVTGQGRDADVNGESVDVGSGVQQSTDKGKEKETSCMMTPRDRSASASDQGVGTSSSVDRQDPVTAKTRGESVDVDDIVQGASITKGKKKETLSANTSHVKELIDYCATQGCSTPSFHETWHQGRYQVWIVIGKERFDLPTTYASAEEGRQRVAKQVLARLSKGRPGVGGR